MTVSIGLGSVASVSWWVGLDRVTQNGPMDDSEWSYTDVAQLVASRFTILLFLIDMSSLTYWSHRISIATSKSARLFVLSACLSDYVSRKRNGSIACFTFVDRYGPITIAIRARFEYDSTTIRAYAMNARRMLSQVFHFGITIISQWLIVYSAYWHLIAFV